VLWLGAKKEKKGAGGGKVTYYHLNSNLVTFVGVVNKRKCCEIKIAGNKGV
jgi:hypothetical protein